MVKKGFLGVLLGGNHLTLCAALMRNCGHRAETYLIPLTRWSPAHMHAELERGNSFLLVNRALPLVSKQAYALSFGIDEKWLSRRRIEGRLAE
jgi:hypothetical protein